MSAAATIADARVTSTIGPIPQTITTQFDAIEKWVHREWLG